MSITKGKWIVDNSFGFEGVRAIVSDSNVYVAELFEGGYDIGQATVEEAESNARLIAAAPKLLEACKKAVCMYEQYRKNLDNGAPSNTFHKEFNSLNRVIAQAEPEPECHAESY